MKITSVCTLLAAFSMLTGCAASEQVHDKNYVRAVAVTGNDGKAAVFSFYDSDGSTFSAMGDDLPSVRRKAEVSLGKTVFTGHTELIVLGDCDYAGTLEFLLNEWKVSPSCLVAYGGPYAAYALKNFDAETLTDSIEHAVAQGQAPECDIVTVLSGLLGDEKRADAVYIGENGVEGRAVLEQ